MTLHEPIGLSPEQRMWRFRLRDFLLLEESGSFADHARAELLDGEIWVVNAIHSRHASVQSEVHGRLWTALRETGVLLRVYLTPSVEIDDGSLPEPDIVVAEPHDDGFLPIAKVRLAIEIADATLATDIGRKQRIYAKAGLPEYWVVDLNAGRIHQMWAPDGAAYREQRVLTFGNALCSETIALLTIGTDAL